MKSKHKKKLVFLIIFVFLISVSISVVFAGRFLVVDEPPQKSDVIIVLAGDSGCRVEHGAALFHAGYAPYLMVCGGKVYHTTTWAGLMREHAIALGVPSMVIIPEGESESTYENAIFARKLMKKHGLKSAVVVSSNYHMRRVKYVFQRELGDTGITLTYSAARDPRFEPARWWANNKSIMYTVNEYLKFIGYVFELNISEYG
jgi:uncharacterized SAM-binding protein YcdF (DUF218 family)